jgi:hypothetical protein
MYTDIRHNAIHGSIVRNLARVRESTQPEAATCGVRASARLRNSVCLPKRKCRQKECWFGQKYESTDRVTVKFSDILAINDFAEANSYMFVGKQLRQYFMGVPMGDPLSCSAAQSVCLDAEIRCDERRQAADVNSVGGGGDSCRNLTLCVMDDLFFRIAYEQSATKQGEWTARSADAYIEQLKAAYPAPLELE